MIINLFWCRQWFVLNSKITYSARNSVWANSQPAVTNWWLMAAPTLPGMAGRVLSMSAVKEMIPQIPDYGFYDGRLIFLKIILLPSEWFSRFELYNCLFIHSWYNTTFLPEIVPWFPYSFLETLLDRLLQVLVLKGRTAVSVLRKKAKWRENHRMVFLEFISSLFCVK